MREITRRYSRMPKQCSNSSEAATGRRGPLRAVPAAAFVLLLFCALAPVSAQTSGPPDATLATEAELTEVETALAELSREVRAVAEELQEQPPSELTSSLESLRGRLERWAGRLPELSVEPAEDSSIDRRRYRRFERRLSRLRDEINAEVERVNELLAAPGTAGVTEDGGSPPAAD